jgi:hemin uptake protein HemP
MKSEEKSSQEVVPNRSWTGEYVPQARELSSEVIFAGTKAITITHEGVRYRLLITRNNKLILQK